AANAPYRMAYQRALAAQPHRHRRSGVVRAARGLRAARRLSRNRAVRGPRLRAPAQARRPRRLPAFMRGDLGAAMASRRRAPDRAPDVAHPRRVPDGRLAGAPGAAVYRRALRRFLWEAAHLDKVAVA